VAERRDPYPGYDVLAKRDGPSWNEQTRRMVDARLAIERDDHRVLDEAEWRVLGALCDRIVPQPADREQPTPLAAMVDRKIRLGKTDGFRPANLPPLAEAWRRGLVAIDAEARAAHGVGFADLGPDRQGALLRLIQAGEARHEA